MTLIKKLKARLASATQGVWFNIPLLAVETENDGVHARETTGDNAEFIMLAHNIMPLLIKAVDELEVAVLELQYLKPERFDDEEHQAKWEKSLQQKLDLLAILNSEVDNG